MLVPHVSLCFLLGFGGTWDSTHKQPRRHDEILSVTGKRLHASNAQIGDYRHMPRGTKYLNEVLRNMSYLRKEAYHINILVGHLRSERWQVCPTKLFPTQLGGI